MKDTSGILLIDTTIDYFISLKVYIKMSNAMDVEELPTEKANNAQEFSVDLLRLYYGNQL